MILDLAHETYQALKLNKLRTALTGFAVAWGIFILIVLLGASNGLINAMNANLADNGDNTLNIGPWTTSKAYNGFEKGRSIKLYMDDKQMLEENNTDRIQEITTELGKSDTLRIDGDFAACSVNGVFRQHFALRHFKTVCGRTFNQGDINEKRKVVVINNVAAEQLFKTTEAALGKRVQMLGSTFTVIGVVKHRWMQSELQAMVPFTTYASIFSQQGRQLYSITAFTKGVNDSVQDKKLQSDIQHQMARRKGYAPDDNQALWMRSSIEERAKNNKAASVLRIAMWILGILTLLSGIVGVSNIMFVTVKERTHEIGVRRAIGAKPRSIYMMIIAESIAVTALFGYIGLAAGVALTQVADYFAETMQQGADMVIFLNPTVGLDIAFEVTVAMIFAGIVAGIFPARKAMHVNPVEALNYE
mgnify:FL=1